MKIKYFAFTLLLTIGSSCSEEFLNKEDVSKISRETFYNTKEHALSAINAAYQPLSRPEMFNLRMWNLDIIAGNSETGGDPGSSTDGVEIKNWANFNLTTDNAAVVDLWRGPWVGVLFSNIALDRVPEIEMEEELKTRILGEAKFLRALNYFYLVRLFGDVPFIDRPNWGDQDIRPSRVSKDRIYDEIIIPDLTQAIEQLPSSYSSSADFGRATKGAAAGILAKVYLTRGNWAKVVELCDVVKGLGYNLNASYGDNFDPNKEHSIESLFEVEYHGPGIPANFWNDENYSGWQSNFMGPRSSPLTTAGWGWNQPTREFVSQYEEGDLRRDETILYEGGPDFDGQAYRSEYAFLTGFNVRKFLVEKQYQPTWDSGSPLNFPILRYADVLLMKAEALTMLGQTSEAQLPGSNANATLNKVRSRAGLPDVTGLGQNELRERILKERRIELAFEGDRWFDLVRVNDGQWGIDFLHSIGKTNAAAKHLLLPIPQEEYLANPNVLPNNPGY